MANDSWSRRKVANWLKQAQREYAEVNARAASPEQKAREAEYDENVLQIELDAGPVTGDEFKESQVRSQIAALGLNPAHEIQLQQNDAQTRLDFAQDRANHSAEPDGFWTKMRQRFSNLVNGKGFHDDETLGRDEELQAYSEFDDPGIEQGVPPAARSLVRPTEEEIEDFENRHLLTESYDDESDAFSSVDAAESIANGNFKTVTPSWHDSESSTQTEDYSTTDTEDLRY